MKVLFTLILIIYLNYSYSQTASTTVAHNDRNIYFQAITQYLNFEKSERGLTLDTIYIEDAYGVTDSLLRQIGQTTLVKIKTEDISSFLKSRKGINLYKVIPLRFENGEFSVSFLPSFISYDKKKRNMNNVNSGTYRVVYKFDNNK